MNRPNRCMPPVRHSSPLVVVIRNSKRILGSKDCLKIKGLYVTRKGHGPTTVSLRPYIDCCLVYPCSCKISIVCLKIFQKTIKQLQNFLPFCGKHVKIQLFYNNYKNKFSIKSFLSVYFWLWIIFNNFEIS